MSLEAGFDFAREVVVHLAVVVALSEWAEGVPADKGVEFGARGEPQDHIAESGDEGVVGALGVEVGTPTFVSSHTQPGF